MVFFELRWNYSPLKEKAVLLPDGLFVCFVAMLRIAPHRYGAFVFVEIVLLLMQAARRVVGLAADDGGQNLSLSKARSTPLYI